jgi:hypothetical protein
MREEAMHDGSEGFRQAGVRETDRVASGLVPVGVAPPLRLAGTDDDEDEDGLTIVRSID